MVIVGILSWWYTSGLHKILLAVSRRFISIFDYFSIDLLLRTLFSPYRQISAGSVDGPLGMQLRAFFDQLLSRIIGATLRFIVMIIGVVTLLLVAVASAVQLGAWLLLPAAPIVGLILMFIGWLPWTL